MTDPEKQATFVAGLRKFAEEAAAKNPALTDMRTLAKAIVAEARTKITEGEAFSPLGAYMGNEGEISILRPKTEDPNRASADILLQLRREAKDGSIRAAALCDVFDKQVPGGPIVKFIQVHMEHAVGKAFVSAVPADESVLLVDAPGADGPALNVFGGPTQSKIFA